ncbi:hypothetical protein SK128_019538 [Halocaridina rubra]|uniref:Uncharacterized protein n=1 Tax=Halocaridina rubra TaxID=373956 RepID=A0AAN8ZTZ4_HALRR
MGTTCYKISIRLPSTNIRHIFQVNCGGGVISYGKRRRRAVNMSLFDDDYDNFDKDVNSDDMTIKLEISTDGTENGGFTSSINSLEDREEDGNNTISGTDGPVRTTKRDASWSPTTTSIRTSRSTASTSPATTDSEATKDAKSSPTPNENVATTEKTKNLADMPGDIPVALSLVVGEDTMPDGWDDRHRYRYRDDTFIADDYVCTPTSTVVAAVLTLLVLLCAGAIGFVFFYRSRKRHWQKMGNCDPFPVPPQPKNQFFNSPEVMFRAAYGGFPGQSNMATNMAAFTASQNLSPMHLEDSPPYKEC